MTNKPNLAEIATTRDGRDITRGFVDGLPWLQNTDAVLREAGGWQGYEAMLKDDQVAATFAQRRLAVVSRPWIVEAASERRVDQRAADLVRETLDAIAWDAITDQMLHARFYGFAAAEVIWAATPAGIRVADIRPRDRRRFVFAPDGALKLLTARAWDGEPLPARKFWVASVGASHADEPYGRGLAHALYGPTWMKRQGARFWGLFLEKFGAPTVVGHFHDGASPEERAKLLAAAQAVMTDAGVILPEGVTLELLEASRGGQAGYETWMRYWDAAIAKIVLGQTMTTDNGSSRSQAEVHYSVRQDIVAADADLIDASASQSWVRWLVAYNHPDAAPPSIRRDLSEPEDMLARAERDAVLSGIGIRLTPEAVKRVYGDDYEIVTPPPGGDGQGRGPGGSRIDAGSLSPTPSPTGGGEQTAAHAEAAAQPDAADLLTARLAEEAAAPMAGLLDTLSAMIDQAGDLEELRAMLEAAYPKLDRAGLVAVMAQALQLAELHGMSDVQDEAAQ